MGLELCVGEAASLIEDDLTPAEQGVRERLRVREPYLLRLCLKRGGQHVGEELQYHRKQELHEGNNDEDQEGEESEDVSASPQELGEYLQQSVCRELCGSA